MVNNLRKFYQYRYLVYMWMLREIKIRYKQSMLGVAWAVLQPLSLMLIYTLVFSYFVQIPTGGIPYPIFSYVAILPWTLFSTSLSFGIPSLVANMNLLTKIYFPREILPLTPIGASLLDFMIGFLVFLVFMILYRVHLYVTILWLPILLIIQIVLTLGVSLFASALNVFYRDIRFMVPLVIQLWFYATPIIYPYSSVPEWLRPIYNLNPMVGIIDSYRRVILLGQPPLVQLLAYSTVISIILFILAYVYFKRVEWKFADLI
jgi:lipopolysaccharide transport system permease protein